MAASSIFSHTQRKQNVTCSLGLKILFLILLSLALSGIAAAWDQNIGSYGHRIYVGGIWDLSGPGSMSGQAALSGARRAVHDINMQGGLRGRNLELIAADSAGNPGTLLQAASRLTLSEHCTIIVGPTHAAFCRTLRGFAEAHRIPLFLTAGDEPILPLRGHPVDWTFSVSPTITSQVKCLFRRLKNTMATPVGIVASNDSIGQRNVLWIKGYAQEFQIVTGELQGYGNQDTDIISQIKLLRASGASTVYVYGRRGVAPMIAASMKKLPGRYAVPCTLLDDSLFAAAQAGATIVAAVPPILMRDNLRQGNPCSQQLRRFLAAMSDNIAYMSAQEILASASAWDAVHLAAMALRRSGTSRRAVQGAMEEAGLEYAGTMGLFRPVKRNHCGLVPSSLTPATLSAYGWRPF